MKVEKGDWAFFGVRDNKEDAEKDAEASSEPCIVVALSSRMGNDPIKSYGYMCVNLESLQHIIEMHKENK